MKFKALTPSGAIWRFIYVFIVSLIIFPVYTLILSAVFIVLSHLFPHQDAIQNKLVSWWGRGVCRLFSVKLKIRFWQWQKEGLTSIVKAIRQDNWESFKTTLVDTWSLEKKLRPLVFPQGEYQPVLSCTSPIPPAQAKLILFNHSSFFDIFSLIAWDERIRFGAKQELFRIPVFAWAMRKAGIVPIPRQDRKSAIQNLSEAILKDRNQHPLALAPEGGRLGGDDYLAPFKSGPFYLAQQGLLSIQMVLIRGASKVWPKGALIAAASKWSYSITIDVLPIIPEEVVSAVDKQQLKEVTYFLSSLVLEQIKSGV